MKNLLHELIPHAPQMGLYVEPNIPPDKLRNALHDYAPSMQPGEVVALFDATFTGNAKDGAVFATDRFIFQNNDLEPAHEVRYTDLVRVEKKRGFLKGAKVVLEVNRGRATFDLELDSSFRPQALEFLYRFLHEAMLLPVEPHPDPPPNTLTTAGSDVRAVHQALDTLRAKGHLAEADYHRLLDALDG